VSLRRILSIALLVSAATVSAQAASPPTETPGAPQATGTPAPKGEWNAADYKNVRDRDEARQRDWDRRMKAVAGSICTGC
jgi:hypothetical protein